MRCNFVSVHSRLLTDDNNDIVLAGRLAKVPENRSGNRSTLLILHMVEGDIPAVSELKAQIESVTDANVEIAPLDVLA